MTRDEKRDAWLKLMTAFLVSSEDSAPEGCSTLADQALALMEQREREGWFGAVEDRLDPATAVALDNQIDRLRERGDKAEAEVERLRADLDVAVKAGAAENADRRRYHDKLVKTEFFLKEALGALSRISGIAKDGEEAGSQENQRGRFVTVRSATDRILARASQEGFEP